MRYMMKQKLWSWGDDFTIKDEAGQDRFFVDGRAVSLGDKLSFQDMQGHEIALVRQQLLAWGPTWHVERGGRRIATVRQKLFTLLKYRFAVDVPGPDDLEVQGDFWAHEYAFTRQGREVAAVSKRWFAWADTYGVDVQPGEDDVLILACTVVVDLATEKHQRHD